MPATDPELVERARTDPEAFGQLIAPYQRMVYALAYGQVRDFEDARLRFLLVHALIRAGFTRIVVYTRHVHVDICDDEHHPSLMLKIGLYPGKTRRRP